MDRLLLGMKSIAQLDDSLSKLRQNKPEESTEIQGLENQLIEQMIEIGTQLDDRAIIEQVDQLTHQLQGTSLVQKLRPVVLTGQS
jgi:hypothetical protein